MTVPTTNLPFATLEQGHEHEYHEQASHLPEYSGVDFGYTFEGDETDDGPREAPMTDAIAREYAARLNLARVYEEIEATLPHDVAVSPAEQ